MKRMAMSKPKNKYIALDKMGKKARQEVAALRRRTWGSLNPVTRRSGNHKAYNRNSEKRQHRAMLTA